MCLRHNTAALKFFAPIFYLHWVTDNGFCSRPYVSDLFECRIFYCASKKICLYTLQYFISIFAHPNENAISWWLKTIPSLIGACAFLGIWHRDVIVFKKLRFHERGLISGWAVGNRAQQNSVSKNPHSWERFWKDTFSLTVFTGYV